jgi:hypothetical protein
VDAFSRAVQIDPENGEAWNNIGCLYAHPSIFIPSLLCCSGDGFRCPGVRISFHSSHSCTSLPSLCTVDVSLFQLNTSVHQVKLASEQCSF